MSTYTWRTADGITIKTPHYLPAIGSGLDHPTLVCMQCKKQIILLPGKEMGTARVEAWEHVEGVRNTWKQITGTTTCDEPLRKRARQLLALMSQTTINAAAMSSAPSSSRDGGPAYRAYTVLNNEAHAEYTELCTMLGIVTLADAERILII